MFSNLSNSLSDEFTQAINQDDANAIDKLIRREIGRSGDKFNVNARIDGDPLLCIAARQGSSKAASVLLLHGASLEEKTQEKEGDDFSKTAAQKAQTALEITKKPHEDPPYITRSRDKIAQINKGRKALAKQLKTITTDNDAAVAKIKKHLELGQYQEAHQTANSNFRGCVLDFV